MLSFFPKKQQEKAIFSLHKKGNMESWPKKLTPTGTGTLVLGF